MNRSVKKLFDMEIDEVSLVDRPANQHGVISFSKSAAAGEGLDYEEDSMADLGIYDPDGDEVAVEELEHGDVVFDAEGNEYVFVEDDDDDDYDVEKASFKQIASAAWNPLKRAGGHIGRDFKAAGSALGNAGRHIGSDAARGAKGAYGAGKRAALATGTGIKTGATSAYTGTKTGLTNGAKWVKANPWQTAGIAAGGAGLGAAGYYGAQKMQKSLGDAVLEDLSKAMSDFERNEIVAKAMDEVEIAKAAAAEAWAYAEAEHDARVTEAFISKAADYNLPVAPEVFGPILKSIAETLDDEDLAILDEIFQAIGEVLYDEVGYVGDTSNSSVLDAVDGYASEMVGKSDLSYERAVTAMFEANPSAYDAYISEMGR